MKRYKGIAQKILIVFLTVIMLSFSIPKPVQADWGGILMSPIASLITAIPDAFQWVLEATMVGRPNYFMNEDLKDHKSDAVPEGAAQVTIKREEYGKIDGAFLALDHANIPDIQYTPEAIFSNRVPALDINFIKPSVTGNEEVEEHNIAVKLQPVIASWYTAIRMIAVVGLLSVLVYLGIRILLTSAAADKAKYKKILLDWLVAVCLIFALHYIMSLALTAAETVTSLIYKSTMGEMYVTVEADVADLSQDVTFKTTLMNYVRFMVQCTDFTRKMGFLLLYIMLVIFNWRFTWTYLKRVVNMAFLTLIAPIVALTYPIDKVGDGKAQAFDLWIKEFTFNALLQPLHLLLYIVLLGSATQLAATNPLYAIVCLGFILTGEKLLKQMFGFGKAGAGTVGSLAGAAAVTTLANKALMGAGKKMMAGNGGGSGKVRTNDKYQREGKNEGANKDYQSFNRADNLGIEAPSEENESPTSNVPPPGGNEPPEQPQFGKDEEEEMARLQDYFDNTDNNAAAMNGEEYQANLDRMEELEKAKALRDGAGNEAESGNEAGPGNENESGDDNTPQDAGPNTAGSPNPAMTQSALESISGEKESWSSLREQDKIAKRTAKAKRREAISDKLYGAQVALGNPEERAELKRKLGVGAYKKIRGIKSAGKAMAYNAARGTVKTAARVAAGATLGAVGLAIGATLGDGEKALGMAAGAAALGGSLGGNAFESTLGQVMTDKSTVRDAYGAGKYGSAIEARNEKADKAYLRSQAHQDEYEKYFKKTMTKAEFNKATKSYRESGITDTKTIRKALKLEQKYAQNGGNREEIRKNVQNIVQTYDGIEKAAFRNKEAKEATLQNLESQLTNITDAKQKRAVANQIFQGYVDWRNA